MPVQIHGKDYYTVAERIARLRKERENCTVETQMISATDERVVMKALIYVPIENPTDDEPGRLVATGYAEEERGSTNINTTSALENAETSAVGRALAFFGLAGTEIASADEVANAMAQQIEKRMWADNRLFLDAFEKHYESIQAIRSFLAEDNFDAAKEAMEEIPNDDKMALNRAWTKGGPFNPRETKQIKWWGNQWEKGRKDA